MSIRNWLAKFPAAGGVVALIILVGAFVLIKQGSTRQGVKLADTVYYYDLGSATLFSSARSMLPVDAPDGGPGQGVRASVFTCGACEPAQWKVAFLTSFTDAAIEVLKNPPSQEQDPQGATSAAALDRGELIALPPAAGETARWVPRNGPQGNEIAAAADRMCEGNRATVCLPE